MWPNLIQHLLKCFWVLFIYFDTIMLSIFLFVFWSTFGALRAYFVFYWNWRKLRHILEESQLGTQRPSHLLCLLRIIQIWLCNLNIIITILLLKSRYLFIARHWALSSFFIALFQIWRFSHQILGMVREDQVIVTRLVRIR
jgi:hypothetical protein